MPQIKKEIKKSKDLHPFFKGLQLKIINDKLWEYQNQNVGMTVSIFSYTKDVTIRLVRYKIEDHQDASHDMNMI